MLLVASERARLQPKEEEEEEWAKEAGGNGVTGVVFWFPGSSPLSVHCGAESALQHWFALWYREYSAPAPPPGEATMAFTLLLACLL